MIQHKDPATRAPLPLLGLATPPLLANDMDCCCCWANNCCCFVNGSGRRTDTLTGVACVLKLGISKSANVRLSGVSKPLPMQIKRKSSPSVQAGISVVSIYFGIVSPNNSCNNIWWNNKKKTCQKSYGSFSIMQERKQSPRTLGPHGDKRAFDFAHRVGWITLDGNTQTVPIGK
jgi:hypothetical protein